MESNHSPRPDPDASSKAHDPLPRRPPVPKARPTRGTATRSAPVLGILAPLPAIGALLATQPKYGIPMLGVTLLAILGGALRLWFLQLAGLGGMALASIGWVAFAFQLYDFSASRGSSMILGSGLDQIFGHITLALGISMGVGAFLLRRREWLVAPKTPAE